MVAETLIMTEREVWMKAGQIVQSHGKGAAHAVLGSLGDAVLKPHGCEDWRRVATAVDAIVNSRLRT